MLYNRDFNLSFYYSYRRGNRCQRPQTLPGCCKNCYKMVVYGDTKWMLFTQIFGTFSVVGLAALCVFVAVLCDEIIRAVINSIRFIKIKF